MDHTWRLHKSRCGCQRVPSLWEKRRSLLRGIFQGGAVARNISSGNQVRLGQYGAIKRCTVSVREGSLGETHICIGPEANCMPVCLCWGSPRTGSKTAGKLGGKQAYLSISEASPNQLDCLWEDSPFSWKGGLTWELARLHDWALLGHALLKQPQMLLTRKEEMAGELWHAMVA